MESLESSKSQDGLQIAQGTLCLVATPIGNIKDITLRAIEVLKHADQLWAEDTRNARKLFELCDIPLSGRRIIACHEHNEEEMAAKLIEELKSGASIAYVSDAGMPMISDPGFRLVNAAIEAGMNYTVIPGASSVVSALVLSGMPSDRFAFYGFIPTKAGKRQQYFEKIKQAGITALAFERADRVSASLKAAAEELGADAELAIIREITKRFEEVIRGKAKALSERIKDQPIKGEVVLVFAPIEAEGLSEDEVAARLRTRLRDMKLNAAVREVALQTGWSRNQVYELALKIKDELT